jgi:recombinational DNA repair protein RecT
LPKSTEMAHAIERDESIVKAEPSRVVHDVDDVLDMEVSTVDAVSTETEEAPTGTDTQA